MTQKELEAFIQAEVKRRIDMQKQDLQRRIKVTTPFHVDSFKKGCTFVLQTLREKGLLKEDIK